MPSTSAKQAKFMRAVAHSPKFAKKVGVPQSVGKDFSMADKKTKKFGDGGTTVKKPTPRPFNDPDAERIPTKAEADKLMKPSTKPIKKDPDTLGVKKLAIGGMAAAPRRTLRGGMGGMPARPMMGGARPQMGAAPVTPAAKKGGTMKKCSDGGEAKGGAMKKYAKGGKVFRSSADGIAKKGKTKASMPTMKKGGKC